MTSKRKTKQLRWLVTMMMLAMTMVMPASTWAQVMYTVFNTDTKTLTFKYGNKPEGTDTEKVYDVPTDPTNTKTTPGWLATYKESIETVVFDESFKDARPTSCYKWFYGCSNLTSINNIENLNTEEVTNMSSMFEGCEKLTSLNLSSFNTANVTDMSGMFRDCSGLTSLNLSNFNTANVTTMSKMFGGCTVLKSLNLSSFNTANVTTMSEMFYRCSGLTSLDLSNFDTSNVTTMYHMFGGSSLKSLDLSSFNTANVKDMGFMFWECSGLTSLDLSSFNTSNVTTMKKMFNNCQKLTSLDLSSFNTANVEDMSNMFYKCTGLKSLDVSSFNTAKVTDMSSMFNGCTGLTKIYVSDDFTTGNVSSIDKMFSGCSQLAGNVPFDSNKTDHTMANCETGYFTKSNLTPYVKWNADTNVLIFKVANTKEEGSGVYDLNKGAGDPGWLENNNCEKVIFTSSFKQVWPTSCYQWFLGFSQLTTIQGIENLNTEKVTDMREMFKSCTGLTSLDLSSFNTAEVEEMSYMFYDCSALTSLDLSLFNNAKVTHMDFMFGGCTGLKSLDLSSFTTDEVTNMSNMFVGCSGLTSLDLSSFNTAKVENMSYMFYGSGLISLDLSSFNTAKVEDMSYMFRDCSDLTTIYVSDDFTTSAGTFDSDMFKGCSKLKGATSYDSGKTDKNMANFDGYFTPKTITPYVKWDASTKVLTFKVANKKEAGSGVYDLNEGAKDPGWLENNNCEKVVFTSSFNHAKPTSCYKWFNMFSGLTTIQGIENLNTEKVKNMSYMFYNCRELTSLNLSSFYTANVTNMSYMFSDCPILTSLTLSSFFNTANVTDMSYMFCNCEGLTSLTLSSFNTVKVENMSYMFYNCQSLESLILSSFNTANVTDMSNMFNYCKKLTSLDLSKFNTDNVTNMFQMFYSCSGLTSLNLSNFDTAKVTNMGDMFYECSGLTSLDVSKFNTANVTNMNGMFNSCSGLTSLNLSNFNTANVTNMGWMFNGCSGLTSLNLSSFNTAKVEDMYQMFWGCSSLESLNLSSFNTANVTRMGSMFKGCKNLANLDLSNFDTSNVKDMSGMFWGCSGLTSLDLSSFNTAKVTNMGNMFSDCLNLENLDLSSFNTAKVTDMHYMFPGCLGLTTIYASDDFKIGDDTDGHEMFKDCTSLEGAAKYSDSGNTGIDMANYTTGYFKTYFTLGDSKVELFGEQLTTDILDLSGEKDFVAHAPFKANTAKYSRDLSSSESTWFSLCLPFAYTPNNFTAYKLKGATAEAVEIEEITGEIAAGTPVLFKFKDDVVDVDKKKIEISATNAQIVKAPVEGAKVTGPDGSSLQLCGTYQTKTFTSEDRNAFILLNNKLMNPAKMPENVTTVGVKPFRAYMTLTASAQTSSARAFSIGHGDEGNEGTTAIDLLNSVATDDAEYYDINGRRIDAPAKGVNIVRRGNKTMKLIIK